MLSKVKVLAAAAAVAGSLGAASTSADALTINITFGPGGVIGPNACRFVHAPGVPRFVVRQKLRARGFHNIQNIRFVPGVRLGLFRCKPGRFVSIAKRGPFTYRVVSTARSGRPVFAKRLGFGPGAAVSPAVVRIKLFQRGYRFVNVIGVRHRFGRLVYVSIARKFGIRYRVFSSIHNGVPFSRRPI